MVEIDPELRDQLVFAFGQHGLESMVLARAPGHVLWTEDLALSDIASTEFAVRRVWTQVVVQHAAEVGIIPPDDYLAASAKILGLGYEATSFNPFILVKSGQLSGWSPERWPFNKSFDQFAHLGVRLDQALVYAAAMIASMYREILLIETKQSTIVIILERLSARRHGFASVRFLLSLLPELFGVNVLAHDEASGIIRAWLAEASRRPSLGNF